MKKSIIILIGLLIGFSSQAQQIDYYLDSGYVAEGYDVTAYFNNEAVEGSKSYTTTYDGAKFKFASQVNLDKFKANPSKYVPQYGGYCAYALATNGKKVDADPETFEIRDGKLYMFYNSWGKNTLKNWKKEGPTALRLKADTNWEKVKYKN
ncbi:YHS domain-containing (seleno)protein [uncultured Dokdonia sp.]|uniref:YHS domain-containing (seleno)protein n=1 Tax=uncultured Dokdonia sp. TaxID=575653 RepID=UPI00261886AC|nr:YHS domain-containing (seleno)protein [uncultured Dokdonia sp.]